MLPEPRPRIGEAIIRCTRLRILNLEDALANVQPDDHRQRNAILDRLTEQRALLANQERDEASLYAAPR